jgi:hypothetical protein
VISITAPTSLTIMQFVLAVDGHQGSYVHELHDHERVGGELRRAVPRVANWAGATRRQYPSS